MAKLITYNIIGGINENIVSDTMNFIFRQPVDSDIVLNIGSTGGSVLSAVSLYQFLKQAPHRIVTRNISEVSSAAVLVYLAGARRQCVDIGKFMIHPIMYNYNGDLAYSKLEEMINGLEKDITQYATILTNESKLSNYEDVLEILKYKSLTFGKTEAIKYGIVNN